MLEGFPGACRAPSCPPGDEDRFPIDFAGDWGQAAAWSDKKPAGRWDGVTAGVLDGRVRRCLPSCWLPSAFVRK